ncbi:sulfite exporter TauE/SafE family protein [Ferruginibacter sp. HRS2-29]|uniref:sulfite exporter TauE/SafE family protein n=1 Tax=Ferruginibacter sp. HRS2-29 TaxID=2487334 RepID=UPI0020CC4B8A|nr:sulfite exporter TauE/SafE family protein [Ferruginibacter sp. HRS2-29]MCP9752994.1 sulfite exporter TauE/SafE family protein [Ferruginibacter sp. HRS2-29]
MSVVFIITALVIGFGGSLHCIAMCGPLVMSMPFNFASRKTTAVLIYILFKSLAYGCLGIIMGYVGRTFSILSLQSTLSLVAACCLLLMAVVPIVHNKLKLPKWVSAIYGKVFNQLMQSPRLHWFALFGFLNGWLPCGTVLSALAVAAVPASPVDGFVFMFLFGIATSPVLVSIIVFKKIIMGKRKYIFAHLSRIAMLLVALLLCWRTFVPVSHDGKHPVYCSPFTKG